MSCEHGNPHGGCDLCDALNEQYHAVRNPLLQEIESLQAKLAAQADVLRRASISFGSFCSDEGWSQADMDVLDAVDATLCADKNSYVVDAFMQGKKAECLAEVYSLIEDFGGDFTLQRLKDVMNDIGVR